jgi:ATP-binding cassette subfamily B protein
MEVARPYRLYLWFIVLAMTYVSIERNAKPYLIKTTIDAVSASDYSYIWSIVLIYALVQFGLVVAWSLHDWCHTKFSPQMTSFITSILLKRLNLHPYRFFQEHLSGSLSAKINDVADKVPSIISTMLLEFFQTTLMLIICVILLTRVHYAFGIAITLWILVFVLLSYFKLKQLNNVSAIEAEARSSLWGNVADYLTNMFSVKIFASTAYEQKRLNRYLEDYTQKSRNKIISLKSYFILQGSIFSLYITLSLCATVYLSQQNLITPGDFALIFMLNFEIVNRLFSLISILKDFVSNWGAVEQALAVLEDAPDIQDQPNASLLKVKNGNIVFNSVTFHYKGTQPLFKNNSLTIEAGKRVGLVGYSGGGKTTFVHLILRLFDVTDGKILIDNQDVREVTQESLRSAVAMIPQDPSLFHRSLMENIRYGRIDASDEEVIAAAQRAHAHEFISKLSQGYDSLVGERGVKLSGGQRQRIAIARAILKNAPILILDEATSQLDSVTESLIQESLWDVMQNKTTIVIAHRLSTLLHMDRILVFDHGKIVEDGTHSELLAQGGLYKTLWDAQVGGFLPDKKEE